MEINGQNYTDWLGRIQQIGGELAWIRRNGDKKVHNAERSAEEMAKAVLGSPRMRNAFAEFAAQRNVTEEGARLEAQKILSNMAHDFHLHSAVQPIGYILAKIFGQIFTRIWVNSGQMDKIRELAKDKTAPIVWLPTHKSYVDFLLLSLLSYDAQIRLPAICAAEDFQSSKLIGEALRRCGAFFIRRSFREDPLYWAVFSEYVQQHLFHQDRPIEFFLEGQRSRTGKSVYPRTGLLQLILEPFLRAQIYDCLLIPVTINYDRILEEQLYAHELLGHAKPRETASGLLKARQILTESFGDIFVTIGQPISLRDHFIGEQHTRHLDIRLELILKKNHEEVIDGATQKMALKIVAMQNGQNVLSVWPFMALAMLQMANCENGQMPMMPFALLKERVQNFVGIFEKCYPNRRIRKISGKIDEDISHFLRLHKNNLHFDERAKTVEVVKMATTTNQPEHHQQQQQQVSRLLNSVMVLSNYASLAAAALAPISIFSIVAHGQNDANSPSIYENYNFLRSLLAREFVYEPSKMQEEFELQKSIYYRNNNSLDGASEKCHHHLLRTTMMPYILGHFLAFECFMDLAGQHLFQSEFIKASQQKLMVQLNGGKCRNIPPQMVSLDSIKNAFNSLKSRGAIQIDGGKRVQMDCAGIRKIWKELEKFIQIGTTTPKERSKL